VTMKISRNRRKEVREKKMVWAVLCHLYSGSKLDLGLTKQRPIHLKQQTTNGLINELGIEGCYPAS
jgi:hypothetical protein